MSDIFDLFKKIETKKEVSSGSIEYLIVGLGNIGKEYENTRHNIGFRAVDEVARAFNVSINRSKFKAMCGECTVAGKRALLMKPTTFMNLSGDAVSEAVNFYKLKPENIIVFSDDISISVGSVRIREKGSAGGHNGLKDIIAKIGTDSFTRVRLGVGERPNRDYDLADWVLGKFSDSDNKIYAELLTVAPKICETLIVEGTDKAKNLYNRTYKPEQNEEK